MPPKKKPAAAEGDETDGLELLLKNYKKTCKDLNISPKFSPLDSAVDRITNGDEAKLSLLSFDMDIRPFCLNLLSLTHALRETPTCLNFNSVKFSHCTPKLDEEGIQQLPFSMDFINKCISISISALLNSEIPQVTDVVIDSIDEAILNVDYIFYSPSPNLIKIIENEADDENDPLMSFSFMSTSALNGLSVLSISNIPQLSLESWSKLNNCLNINNGSLKYLNLSNLGVDFNDLTNLSFLLNINSKLKTICLPHNNISNLSIFQFLSNIAPSIVQIDLSFNRIILNKDFFTSFLSLLQTNPHLAYWHFKGSWIDSADFGNFSIMLKADSILSKQLKLFETSSIGMSTQVLDISSKLLKTEKAGGKKKKGGGKKKKK